MKRSTKQLHRIRVASRLASLACFLSFGILAESIDADYRASVEQWRQEREAALKADGGWLTVTGLFWLKDGSNTVGSDAANDILLPDGSPARFGDLQVKGGRVLFVSADASVRYNGKAVERTEVRPVGSDVLSSGAIQLFVIRRGERLGLRLKDDNSRLRTSFTHLRWYPVQENWKITARFIPAPAAEKIVFDTIIGGQEESNSPGFVEFERDGKTYRLQAAAQGRRLFFVLRDQTSGKQTYAASRFLYADAPKNGTVILDFNKAENPPCAFTPYATCPLPPPQNRLGIAVTAGEMKYEGSPH